MCLNKKLFSVLFLTSIALFVRIAVADNVYFRCDPNAIVEKNMRVQIGCSNSIDVVDPGTGTTDTISRVAIFITANNENKVKRFEDMAATALSCGLHFLVRIPEDRGVQPAGCEVTNCRVPNRFGISRP